MPFSVNDASQSAAAEVDTSHAGLYSILLPRPCHCGCIPQSLRWRVLDLRTGEAQAADLGYVVGCTVVTREAEEDWRKEKWRQRRARAHLCLAWSHWPLC